jgi:hypothetical protein
MPSGSRPAFDPAAAWKGAALDCLVAAAKTDTAAEKLTYWHLLARRELSAPVAEGRPLSAWWRRGWQRR